MTSFYLTMPSSTPHPSPLTFRRCTTTVRPNPQQGLIIEYSLIHPSATATTTTSATTTTTNTTTATTTDKLQQPTSSDPKLLPPLIKDSDAGISPTPHVRQPKPWLGLSNTGSSFLDKRRRLEKVNLRGEPRPLNLTRPAADSGRTVSSCKRSDSATNDSQKSTALTVNSLEERVSEERARQLARLELGNDEDLTEEKLERRRNFEKCMSWIEALPSKFSGMHIVQERAPVVKD